MAAFVLHKLQHSVNGTHKWKWRNEVIFRSFKRTQSAIIGFMGYWAMVVNERFSRVHMTFIYRNNESKTHQITLNANVVDVVRLTRNNKIINDKSHSSDDDNIVDDGDGGDVRLLLRVTARLQSNMCVNSRSICSAECTPMDANTRSFMYSYVFANHFSLPMKAKFAPSTIIINNNHYNWDSHTHLGGWEGGGRSFSVSSTNMYRFCTYFW